MRSQEEKKKQAKRKRRLRKRAVRIWIFIYTGILLCVGCIAFLIGKCVGVTEAQRVGAFVGDELFSAMDEESGEKDSQASREMIVEAITETDIHIEEIILVNRDNPLHEGYEVELVTLPDGVNRADKIAYHPLCDMLKAGAKEGLHFEICSSYRDIEYQKHLFEEDVAVLMRRGYSYPEAYEEVAKETMPPGCSEHSTGLAFDIVASDYQMLDGGQENTEENQWLQKHCAEYGFILRYPKGKEEITSINYESWHFRYVGKEAATYIMENEITLEEYLESRAVEKSRQSYFL